MGDNGLNGHGKQNNKQTTCMFCGVSINSTRFPMHFRQCPRKKAITRSQDVELLAKTPRGVVV